MVLRRYIYRTLALEPESIESRPPIYNIDSLALDLLYAPLVHNKVLYTALRRRRSSSRAIRPLLLALLSFYALKKKKILRSQNKIPPEKVFLREKGIPPTQ